MNDRTLPSINDNLKKSGYEVTVLPDNTVTHGQQPDRAPLILLAVSKLLHNELTVELKKYNYNVAAIDITASNKARLIPVIYHRKPDIVVVDYELLDDSLKFSLSIVKDFLCFESTSIIFLSKAYNTKKHLAAVEAGGSAFLTTPVDINALVSTIDNICSTEAAAPSKVTIIDDDAASAAYYSAILNGAGFDTSVITKPLDSIKILIETRPDLILLDLYMPDCNGQELAAVIRQKDPLLNIPIVFLSAETDIKKQLISTKQGIDGFITKDIEPEDLVSVVNSTIKRSHQLKSLMIKDNLTGLLNRQAFHDRLDNEMARAKRSGRSLSLAMLDIDHFKQINDKYGHAEGDKIIIYVATFLRSWLRHSDIICRYGGEEFLILFPDTKQTDAFYLIEKIRQACSDHIHTSEASSYSVTFSCGIASMNKKTTAKQLIRNADEAMYKSKNTGRNKVCIF